MPAASSASGRVDILPRKIFLDDRERSADITILNMGAESGTIRLSIISYRQDESGTYALLEGPLSPDFDPEQFVRFSPRQFVLPPGGRQKVRVSVQRPASLPDGEYRFHVKAMSYDDKNSEAAPSQGSRLAIQMNVAVAIPVVVRKGAIESGARIENATLLGATQNEYGRPALKFDVSRTGAAGTMGTIEAFWEVAGSPPVKIAGVGNFNVFAEVPKRTVIVPLEQPLSGAGVVRIRYRNDFGDKGVFDEVVLQQ